MFIGREREISYLNELYTQNKFQLFILYGRRRVGKTTLLKEFCKGKEAIFYSAEQSNEKTNIEKFSKIVFSHYEETTLEPFASWENALNFINNKQTQKPLILVLDEFPYLADINPSLLSIFQHLIDHKLKTGKLFIVLCGSYVGFMEKEVLGSRSPLFGRRTSQLHMRPFDYKTSIRFLNEFSQEEKLMFYGAFGGTAMYLQYIRKEKSLKQNIIELFLTPIGYLYEEPLLLLRQEVQEPGIYCAIIEAIANGASKINEISTKTGENSAKCLKYISVLRELGIVYKEVPFGEKASSRKTLYQISDLMFRFWYRYVSRNKTLLETDGQEVIWEKRIEPDYSSYMGHVFEIVCRDYLLYQNSKGKLPILFSDIGRWWGTDSKKREQVEIDLVAKDNNDYIFCECKWRNELLDLSVLKDLHNKANVFCEKRNRTIYILFSKSGFSESIIQEAKKSDNIILVTLDEILNIS